jgi:orotidine-5'-phosphate decarboxylase
MSRIIGRNKSIIPACDISFRLFNEIVTETEDIEGVGAYKVGFRLGLTHGLARVVQHAKEHTDKPIIYDHQKAGTDIPEMGEPFMDAMVNCGVDAVILIPQAGPMTEYAWIKAAQDRELGVIVGGHMSHKKYVTSDGGFIIDDAIDEMYQLASEMGVKDFVIPGNNRKVITRIRGLLKGNENVFYAPGLVNIRGVSQAAKVAGDNWHAIIGRGIYTSDNIRKASINLCDKL